VKARTFLAARADILAYLASHGWQVSGPLKVPHATHPSGTLRLWFKPQAVYYTAVRAGQRHDFHAARTLSYDLDIRTIDSAALVAFAESRGFASVAETFEVVRK
jgi:hypothetical protein